MTGKNHGWHKRWQITKDGHLLHDSGLLVLVTEADGYVDLETDDASMTIFRARELSRGVPEHDLTARVQRLIKEAETFYRYTR